MQFYDQHKTAAPASATATVVVVAAESRNNTQNVNNEKCILIKFLLQVICSISYT